MEGSSDPNADAHMDVKAMLRPQMKMTVLWKIKQTLSFLYFASNVSALRPFTKILQTNFHMID